MRINTKNMYVYLPSAGSWARDLAGSESAVSHASFTSQSILRIQHLPGGCKTAKASGHMGINWS
jgi:hypothetical protein